MADRPILYCKEGPLLGQVFPVEEGGMEIGRSPENDLVIDDDGVSRFHARLLYDNGALWLRDAGSRNGLFVNGRKIGDHKALKVGDEVRIGSTVLEVRWEDGARSEPGPADKGGWRRWLWPFE